MAFPSLDNAINKVPNRYMLVVLAAKGLLEKIREQVQNLE